MKRNYRGKFWLKIPMVILFIALFSLFTMLLWNNLMPVIFGLPVITYPQALGLLVLSKILLGGFGPGGFRGRGGCGPARDKWMKMSPEEREQFIKFREQNFNPHTENR